MREEYRDKTIVNTNSSEDKSDRILFVNILQPFENIGLKVEYIYYVIMLSLEYNNMK